MALQQAMDTGARKRSTNGQPSFFHQKDQLVDGAAGLVALGIEDGILNVNG